MSGQLRNGRLLAERLGQWGRRPADAGILTDFDGTLAPIVADPDAARPLPGTAEVLGALAERLAVVAVVSGRPAEFLADHLPGAGRVVLAGLYGLERVVGGRVVEADEARHWRPAVARVAALAEARAPTGVLVERKGPTVALHVRTAPEELGWVERFAAEQSSLTGLVAHRGRMSVELRPPSGADKGSVVSELGAGLSAVAFFGDDRGDLPAFAALDRLRTAGARTLAVAVDSPESPVELLDAADLVVDGPEAVLEGLESILRP